MMRVFRQPTTMEFLAIGCKIGQEIIQQIRTTDKEAIMYVYDAKTEKLNNKNTDKDFLSPGQIVSKTEELSERSDFLGTTKLSERSDILGTSKVAIIWCKGVIL